MDLGGIRLGYPALTKRGLSVKLPGVTEATKLSPVWIEWRHKTWSDLQRFYEGTSIIEVAAKLGAQESRAAKVTGSVLARVPWALGAFHPRYDEFGRIPDTWHGASSSWQHTMRFLRADEQRRLHNILQENKLDPMQMQVVRTALDANRPIAGELEAVRLQIVQSELGEKLANAKQYWEAVDWVSKRYDIDPEDALVVIKARVNDVKLDEPRLAHVTNALQKGFEEELRWMKIMGREVPETLGGGYWPRFARYEKDMWESVEGFAQKGAARQDALDQYFFSQTDARSRAQMSQGKLSSQGFERARSIYALIGPNGQRKVESIRHFARAQRTTFTEFMDAMKHRRRELQRAVQVKIGRADRLTAKWLALSGGMAEPEVREALKRTRGEIATFTKDIAEPADAATKRLRGLQYRQEQLEQMLGGAADAAGLGPGADIAHARETTRLELLRTMDDIHSMNQMLDAKPELLGRIERLRGKVAGLEDIRRAPRQQVLEKEIDELGYITERTGRVAARAPEVQRQLTPDQSKSLDLLHEELRDLNMQTDSLETMSPAIADAHKRIGALRDDLERNGRALHLTQEVEKIGLEASKTETAIDALNRLAGSSDAKSIKDLLTEKQTKLKELGRQHKAAKKALSAELSSTALQKQFDTHAQALEDEIEALMARIPLGADEIFLKRGPVRRAGMFTTGQRVRVHSQTGAHGEVHGLVAKDAADKRSAEILNARDITDLEKNKANYRVVVRMDNGKLEDFAVSDIARTADYSHITAYTKEKAFFDEVQFDLGGMYDEDFTRTLAQHSRQYSAARSGIEFVEELKRQGYAVKMENGVARDGWEEGAVEFLKGYEVRTQTNARLKSAMRSFRRGDQTLAEAWQRGDGWGFAGAFIDAIHTPWKAAVAAIWPGFTGRNVASNTWLNLSDLGLQALNPRLNAIGVSLLNPFNGLEPVTLRLERRAAGTGPKALDATEQLKRVNAKVIFTEPATGKHWTWGEVRSTMKESRVALTSDYFGILERYEGGLSDAKGWLGRLKNTGIRTGVGAAGMAAAWSAVASGTPHRLWQTGAAAGAVFGAAGPSAAKAGWWLAGMAEQQARIVNFFGNLERYGDVRTAAEHVQKFLFDYQDLSPFMRNTVRRMIPFATWSFKNLALQTQLAYRKPSALARQGHLIDLFQQQMLQPELSEEEIAAMPEYRQRQLGVLVERPGMGAVILNEAGIPAQTLAEGISGFWHSGGLSGPFGMGSWSPALSYLGQKVTKRNWYFDSSVEKLQRWDDIQAILDLPGFPKKTREIIMGWVEVGKPSWETGELVQFAHNGVAVMLIRNFPPFSRFLSEARKLSMPGLPMDRKMLDFFVGIDFSEYTQDDLEEFQKRVAAELHLKQRRQEATREAIAGDKNPRYAEALTEATEDLEHAAAWMSKSDLAHPPFQPGRR